VMYYASMLRCWELIVILVKTNHPCLRVGRHRVRVVVDASAARAILTVFDCCMLIAWSSPFATVWRWRFLERDGGAFGDAELDDGGDVHPPLQRASDSGRVVLRVQVSIVGLELCFMRRYHSSVLDVLRVDCCASFYAL
jgi:hypothetical protein